MVEERLEIASISPSAPDPHRDLLEPYAVPLRQGGAQPVGAAVRVAVQLGGGPGERVERRRKGPERALVRRELDDAFEAELALHLLDRLAGLVGDQAAERTAERTTRSCA